MSLRIAIVLFVLIPIQVCATDKFWIQFMPNNQLWLRLITDKETCPNITMDGVERQMRYHSRHNNAMQITSCKLHIPKGLNEIKVYDKTLKIPRDYRKILLIGDTGCRLKGLYSQDCKIEWPFAQVAVLAAQHNPDLVIHLGDYLYRELCTSAECISENTGDKWQAWRDDFFLPVGELLSSAPWIMTRGNHETCKRGGNGWFSFFDYRKKCYKYTRPYSIDLSPDLRLIVADSGEANLSPEVVNKVNDMAYGKRSWLITHRPFWVDRLNGIDYESKPSVLASTITTILSGHIHILQLSEVDGKVQVISGNGGSALYPVEKFSPHNTKGGFGFIVLEKKEDNNWQLNSFDLENKITASRIIK